MQKNSEHLRIKNLNWRSSWKITRKDIPLQIQSKSTKEWRRILKEIQKTGMHARMVQTIPTTGELIKHLSLRKIWYKRSALRMRRNGAEIGNNKGTLNCDERLVRRKKQLERESQNQMLREKSRSTIYQA